ncbi:unnamed protein product [Arctia plantaginis]|uniref:CHK kinase-like domain-containing protein n=1 Tax=Arctia plantaginis TaxID=874455 RepID=A0A8S0YL79_ARCPL|nr:unnamed protein product [Arctia plantaginis]
MASVKAVESVQETTRDQLKRFFDTFDKKRYPQFYVPTRRPVLAHLDYRPSNLMYRTRDDGTVEIKIVDLQSLQGCSPVFDLLYFIVSGTDENFRAQYYEKLRDHYYTELEAAMKRLHLEPEKVYSRADFEHELKEKLPFGLIMAVMILPIVTVSIENAPEVNDTIAMTDFSVEPANHLYTERLNGIVNDYIKWGILQ